MENVKRKFHIEFDIETDKLDYNDISALVDTIKDNCEQEGDKLLAIAIFEENEEYPNQTVEMKGKG